MNTKMLKELLTDSWTKETCVSGSKEEWNIDNPSLGQSDITSLIVNDYFGGKIMTCMTSTGSHYYNLIDNKIVDLTKDQFLEETPNYEEGEERTREYLLSNEDTKNRYIILLNNLKSNISNMLDKTKELLHVSSKEDYQVDKETSDKRYEMCVEQRKKLLPTFEYIIYKKETKKEIGYTLNYLNWLSNFTIKHPTFYDDDWQYEELSEEDISNMKNLNILFEVINDYAEENNIDAYNQEEFGGYYSIKNGGIAFDIGFMHGQGTSFFCERTKPIDNSIEYIDIINYYKEKEQIKNKVKKK